MKRVTALFVSALFLLVLAAPVSARPSATITLAVSGCTLTGVFSWSQLPGGPNAEVEVFLVSDGPHGVAISVPASGQGGSQTISLTLPSEEFDDLNWFAQGSLTLKERVFGSATSNSIHVDCFPD